MTGLDIFMIVLGLGLVIISFILSEQFTKKDKREQEDVLLYDGMELTNQQFAKVEEKIKELLEEKVEDAIVKVDDSMSQISNEKIMAFSEYSDQIIEKINQNHSEVVFLYNMLNEKDSEMKKLVQKLSKVNVKLEDELVKHTNQNEDISSQGKSSNVNSESTKDFLTKPKKLSSENIQKEALIKALKTNKVSQETDANSHENQTKDSSVTPIGDNKNEAILKLYAQGKNILEISKTLGLGQGEVKLVIDLFHKVKGEGK